MQHLSARTLLLQSLGSPPLSKALLPLARVTHILYPNRTQADRKSKCFSCSRQFESLFMLIMHLEIVHNGVVEKYEIKNQTLTIKLSKNANNEINPILSMGFLKGFAKTIPGNSKYYDGKDICQSLNFSRENGVAHLSQRMQTRSKMILTNIVNKLQKAVERKEQIYFHSTNIFKKVSPESEEQDSQDEIGEVQRELEKLRIEDFSDVNDNDKKFFIEWNGFIHENRKKLSIIYTNDMPDLFVKFSGMIYQKGIPRINLVMHAWTLWSVGQISSNDIVRGLQEYDESIQQPNNALQNNPAF